MKMKEVGTVTIACCDENETKKIFDLFAKAFSEQEYSIGVGSSVYGSGASIHVFRPYTKEDEEVITEEQ